jgi:hypothetical protein
MRFLLASAFSSFSSLKHGSLSIKFVVCRFFKAAGHTFCDKKLQFIAESMTEKENRKLQLFIANCVFLLVFAICDKIAESITDAQAL